MIRLGIDIGGSGIKGAPVDTVRGDLDEERLKIETPHPSTPAAVAGTVRQIVDHFAWTGSIGVTFPGVVTAGVVRTAANFDRGWIDLDADELLSAATGCDVHLLNDADAAGIAEMHFGGHPRTGVVFMLTLGTGIGSALFLDGQLVPNTELGHLELDGVDAEKRAAARIREDEDLSWSEYAGRLSRYLHAVEQLLWPDLFIIGGGISRKSEKFFPMLSGVRTPVVPATLRNEAGIIGAAMAAG